MKSSIRNILLLMAFGTLSACSEQTVTVSYQEYPNAFRNPMKGFREFFAPGIDRVREEYPLPLRFTDKRIYAVEYDRG